ncbi:hypothetical protein NBRC10512_000335 [Rhodotorula toruloides]|uniref:RHTO0S26e01706g1_1 n=2 Tax=Rhodotorula toruloides TaxID=5286 RepID=A0A061BQV3_RHOTO|nr:uncharacterized protein RHTO_01753 [Rhodotorula toruloides NP11]EMS21287.1 hypothetical protein RHTO_01753 [Rhodotorula toruloides NP11]CDR49435.1 RHTO0S26e01706g1_1 [Rhodotorula toruloides]
MSLSVKDIIGPVLVGACLSCFACGITLSLSTRYWARFHVERIWIRIAVVLSMLLAMIDTAFNGTWAYKWTTTYYVLPDKLSLLPWELTANCFVMSTSIVLAQHFYLYRLFSLSGKNWLVAAPVSVAALGCWGVAIYMGWFCSKHPNDIAAYADITNVSWVWFAGAFVVDAYITAGLAYYLVIRPKSGPSLASSPKIAALRAAQCNAFAILWHLVIVILHARDSNTFQDTYFTFSLVKVYTGSLLATLNARSPHAEGSFTDRFPSRTGHASSFSPSTSSRLKGFGTPAGPPVQVSVRQEMHIEAERGDDEEVLGLEGVKRKKEGGAGGGEVVKVQFAGAGERKGADKAGEGDSDEF